MGKKNKKHAEHAAEQPTETTKLKSKVYEKELEKLHVELVKLQQWVVAKGLKVCIVFEGRDGAGKGGCIKAICERVSPRVFRVVALPAPTERQKTQMYLQRYVEHFPAAGEITIFDRSWYNRAGVERVMGFAAPEQTERFLEMTPAFEKARKSRSAVSQPASTTAARSGSCRRWTSRASANGMIIRAPATPCSPPPTRPGRPGMFCVRTIKSGRG
jgi:polyphosphate kinase 2 (PPK2 family)